MGKLLIVAGLSMALIGAVIVYAPWAIRWFGNLPGDIRIQGEHSSLFIPITSMMVISVAASVLLSLFKS